MGQEVRDGKYRVFLRITDGYLHLTPVRTNHKAIDGKGSGYPLLLLYAAVVVCLEEGYFYIFIKGALFKVEAWAVYMRYDHV